jgi:hypothetical protein
VAVVETLEIMVVQEIPDAEILEMQIVEGQVIVDVQEMMAV